MQKLSTGCAVNKELNYSTKHKRIHILSGKFVTQPNNSLTDRCLH